MNELAPVTIRAATMNDLDAIIAIAIATGQEDDVDDGFPGYVRHLIDHGTFLVAVLPERLKSRRSSGTGPGATEPPTTIC